MAPPKWCLGIHLGSPPSCWGTIDWPGGEGGEHRAASWHPSPRPQALTFLSGVWSAGLKARIRFVEVPRLELASHLLVVPHAFVGARDIVPLESKPDGVRTGGGAVAWAGRLPGVSGEGVQGMIAERGGRFGCEGCHAERTPFTASAGATAWRETPQRRSRRGDMPQAADPAPSLDCRRGLNATPSPSASCALCTMLPQAW